MTFTFGSLFAGIGGFDLGLERAGMTCKWQVENDPYAIKVLEKHWPNVKRFGDIRTIDEGILDPVDLICGGFPCQDVSVAGLRRGISESTRSGLWSEFNRIIGGLRPRFVLIENVSGLLDNLAMRRVLGDLSALGYDAEWESIPAAAVGAPHIRDRVWILAYPGQKHGYDAGGHYYICRCENLSEEGSGREQTEWRKNWKLIALVPGVHPRSSADWWVRQSRMDRSVNGIPRELVDVRNGCLGNAVVPQVAEWIGKQLMNVLAKGVK